MISSDVATHDKNQRVEEYDVLVVYRCDDAPSI